MDASIGIGEGSGNRRISGRPYGRLMQTSPAFLEPTTRRRAFPGWSVEIPTSFDETFILEGVGYWHAWELRRSVSLTSIFLTERGKRVPADEIVRQTRNVGPLEEFQDFPVGLIGWVGQGVALRGSRASRLVSGGLAVEGCILLATITADDLAWARSIWLSIRSHPRGH